MKSIFSKVMWVGEATVFSVGLAVILAVMLGVATTALAANGDSWLLGRSNVATAITRLAGAAGVDGPMLRIDNNNGGANATALNLQVEPGKAPMKVNSDTQVANLNADKLDGQDSSAFLGANQKAADSELLDGRELGSGRLTLNFAPNSGGAFRLLGSGTWTLFRICQRDPSGAARASVRIETTQTGSAVSAHSIELGGVERPTLNPGDRTADIASTGAFATAPGADHATYTAVAPNGDTLQGEVFAGVNLQGNTCVYSASGIG